MLAKIVLIITAIGFMVYGLVCFFQPNVPAEFIGYTLTTADATVEVISMYGGLEFGIGLFALIALFNNEYEKPALVAIICTVGGLAIGRVYGLATVEGIGGYTYGAMVFEFATTILAAVALYQGQDRRPLSVREQARTQA